VSDAVLEGTLMTGPGFNIGVARDTARVKFEACVMWTVKAVSDAPDVDHGISQALACSDGTGTTGGMRLVSMVRTCGGEE
jgi:hypothetical protein